jgi:hypothetical protein
MLRKNHSVTQHNFGSRIVQKLVRNASVNKMSPENKKKKKVTAKHLHDQNTSPCRKYTQKTPTPSPVKPQVFKEDFLLSNIPNSNSKKQLKASASKKSYRAPKSGKKEFKEDCSTLQVSEFSSKGGKLAKRRL